MFKPSTPRGPIIPKLNFSPIPSSTNSEKSESNNEALYEIANKLEKMILGINPNSEIN